MEGEPGSPESGDWYPYMARWALQADVVDALIRVIENPTVTMTDIGKAIQENDAHLASLPKRERYKVSSAFDHRHKNKLFFLSYSVDHRVYVSDPVRQVFLEELHKQRQWLLSVNFAPRGSYGWKVLHPEARAAIEARYRDRSPRE